MISFSDHPSPCRWTCCARCNPLPPPACSECGGPLSELASPYAYAHAATCAIFLALEEVRTGERNYLALQRPAP